MAQNPVRINAPIQLRARLLQSTGDFYTVESRYDIIAEGFRDIIPIEYLERFAIIMETLGVLIFGKKTFDVNDWAANLILHGHIHEKSQMESLCRVMSACTEAIQRHVLYLTTSSAQIPAGGLKFLYKPVAIYPMGAGTSWQFLREASTILSPPLSLAKKARQLLYALIRTGRALTP